MLILPPTSLPEIMTAGPLSPLNVLWPGTLRRAATLPKVGHAFLVFPLGDTAVSCAGVSLDSNHYLLLTRPATRPFTLQNMDWENGEARLLLLLLSPDFLADMADFLGIPADLTDLLHAVPLLQGDQISQLLWLMAPIGRHDDREAVAELFLEVVGQVLQLMRLRHQALLGLSGHKKSTVSDLLPRLLQARQLIEARCPEPLKTEDVAAHVALSSYHFARLFKTAFDVTVHQYTLRLRFEQARHLLAQPGATVTDTALTVGYSSLSAFIHAFRRHFGLTPAAYQARLQRAKS